MLYDTMHISHSLMSLTIEDYSLSQFVEKSIDVICAIPSFCYMPKASVYVVDKNSRVLTLVAHKGFKAGFSAECGRIGFGDCKMGNAVREGQIVLAGPRDGGPRKCNNYCETPMHAIPLRVNTDTIAILNLPLCKEGGISDEQRALIGEIENILARTIKQYLEFNFNSRLAALSHENPNPLLECDGEGNVGYVNPAFKKLLWQHSVEAYELLPSNHVQFVRACIDTQEDKHVQSSVANGVYAWSYQYVQNPNRVYIYGLDISDQRQIERQLAYDTMHDALTGLPNRNQMRSQLENELTIVKRDRAYSFALLLIDVDRFKTIIESLGYSAAEAALREIAKRLESCSSRENVVARFGGDEFAILVQDIKNPSDAIEFATEVREKLAEPIRALEHNISLTMSIGMAIGNAQTKNTEELLQNASAAVYRAKRIGSNRTEVFDKQMHQRALSRLKVHNELSGAIEADELIVYYQPVFSLNDLRVRAFEALARWNHPTKGLVGPAEFIPVAEETGLIHALGTHVIGTVCRQLAKWKEDKLPLAWVSVNISAHQFKLDNLVQDITDLLDKEGADPHRLFVEITEGTAAESPERAFRMMTELKEKGIRLALDDFGTGYSSMAYLKRFPIDALKLDRSFIEGLPENHDDAAIATSVINLAKSLGMKVVAEGVEHERQAMFLRQKGCDEVQGFLYGRPMPAKKATELLMAGRL